MKDWPLVRIIVPHKPHTAGPTMKRGKSVQVVETPGELIVAVEKQWGKLDWDLAATEQNAKASLFITPEDNSLKVQWNQLPVAAVVPGEAKPLLWLNPEFDDAAMWTAKCRVEADRGARIILLSRASTDANWWWDDVARYAVSYTLTPRLKFVGHNQGYPFPLAISLYNIEDRAPGLAGRWHWKEGIFERRMGDDG